MNCSLLLIDFHTVHLTFYKMQANGAAFYFISNDCSHLFGFYFNFFFRSLMWRRVLIVEKGLITRQASDQLVTAIATTICRRFLICSKRFNRTFFSS